MDSAKRSSAIFYLLTRLLKTSLQILIIHEISWEQKCSCSRIEWLCILDSSCLDRQMVDTDFSDYFNSICTLTAIWWEIILFFQKLCVSTSFHRVNTRLKRLHSKYLTELKHEVPPCSMSNAPFHICIAAHQAGNGTQTPPIKINK